MFPTRFINYLNRLFQLPSKLNKHKQKQVEEGFLVELQSSMSGGNVEYREEDNILFAEVDFSWDNNVRLFTRSVEFWSRPRRRELTEIEYERVINRITEYLSLWGKVTYDNSPLTSLEDMKGDLENRNILYEEKDGVIIYKSTAEKERKNRNI
jgi:hypothetical protein